jgi:hypothetical protein
MGAGFFLACCKAASFYGRMKEYIRDHWFGRLRTGWVVANLVGMSLVLGGMIGLLGARFSGVIFGVLAVVTIWQVVGGVRFSERVLREGGVLRVWAVYGAILASLGLNGARALSVVLPQPDVYLEIEGYAPKVVVDGRKAFVAGEVDYQVMTELRAVVAQGEIVEVVLESTGGNVIAGRSIGLFLARQGLKTRVEGRCFSACTLIFVGGVVRVLGPEGRLGFHGYRFDSINRVQTVELVDVVEKDRAYLAGRGVSPDFVDRIFVTPPEVLWEPTRAELRGAGVVTP